SVARSARPSARVFARRSATVRWPSIMINTLRSGKGNLRWRSLSSRTPSSVLAKISLIAIVMAVIGCTPTQCFKLGKQYLYQSRTTYVVHTRHAAGVQWRRTGGDKQAHARIAAPWTLNDAIAG